jgi:hypothetical protein
MSRRRGTGAKHRAAVWMAAAVILYAAPVRADGGYVLRHIGDWALAVSTLSDHPPALFNTTPRHSLARAACAAETLSLSLEAFGYAKRANDRAVSIMYDPGFACLVVSCGRTPQGIYWGLFLSAARHTGPVETRPGRVTLYLQLLPGGKQQTLFKDARPKDDSTDRRLNLFDLGFRPPMSKERPYQMMIGFGAPWSFFAPFARSDKLRLRLPSGRDAIGDPTLDVPHAARNMVFGLSRTRAAFAQFAKACPQVGKN